jgi:uracil-DNA glycosylase
MTHKRLQQMIISCRKCPRLVKWRENVARVKVSRFENQRYWGKPVPGFGDPAAELLLVGLAPAAHGGNRTGRMFTGDRSGDWLYHALYKAGFANQQRSVDRADGLKLINCYITASCRCAQPENKPLQSEIQNCRPFLLQELQLLSNIRVIVGLGRLGFIAAVSSFRQLGMTTMKNLPKFIHGAEYSLNERISLIASYHPSQQNTFTGRLSMPMTDRIFKRVKLLLEQK